MFKNKKTWVVLLLIIIVVFIIIKIFIKPSPTKEIKNYILKQKFVSDIGESLYVKQLSKINLEEYTKNVNNKENSSYNVLYFDMDNYKLIQSKIDYLDELESNFSPTYNYITDVLTYNYRMTYGNLVAIFKGEYISSTDEFICEMEYGYFGNLKNSKEEICSEIKYKVDDFNLEVKKISSNKRIIELMKKEKS